MTDDIQKPETSQSIETQQSPTVEIPQPRKKAKLWKILAVLLVILIPFGLLGYFILNFLTNPRPINDAGSNSSINTVVSAATPLDDSSLRLNKVSVLDADNGFFDLNKITADTIIMPTTSFDSDYTNYSKPVEWNQQLVDKALADNSTVLALFDSASQKSIVQNPAFADPAELKVGMKVTPMGLWRTASRLQAIKALSLAHQGKIAEALQEATKLNKVGHEILSGQNGSMGILLGGAIEGLGSDTIAQILKLGNPTKASLELTQGILRKNGDNVEAFKNAIKSDYTLAMNDLDEEVNKQTNGVQNNLYNPVETKNLFVNGFGIAVAAVGVRCEFSKEEADEATAAQQIKNQDSYLYTENGIGKLLYYLVPPAWGNVLNKQCKNELINNVTQIELALKMYSIDHGSLPSTLNDLIPTYISSTPIDPFDHQPIRYSQEKKIIYSVGVNKKDLGGSEGVDWTTMENPTFRIEF